MKRRPKTPTRFGLNEGCERVLDWAGPRLRNGALVRTPEMTDAWQPDRAPLSFLASLSGQG